MSVHLVTGDDPVLRADALTALVEELLAGADRTLALEEFEVPGRAGGDEDGGGGADARGRRWSKRSSTRRRRHPS